jgi:hypothetical protein
MGVLIILPILGLTLFTHDSIWHLILIPAAVALAFFTFFFDKNFRFRPWREIPTLAILGIITLLGALVEFPVEEVYNSHSFFSLVGGLVLFQAHLQKLMM